MASRLLAGSTMRPPASLTSVTRHRWRSMRALDAVQHIGRARSSARAQRRQRQRHDAVAAEDLSGVIDAGRADGNIHLRLAFEAQGRGGQHDRRHTRGGRRDRMKR